MAAPDIDLPSEDDLGRISGKTTAFGDDEDKKNYNGESTDSIPKSSETTLDESSPIIYHYLTSDPATPSFNSNTSESLYRRTPTTTRPQEIPKSIRIVRKSKELYDMAVLYHYIDYGLHSWLICAGNTPND